MSFDELRAAIALFGSQREQQSAQQQHATTYAYDAGPEPTADQSILLMLHDYLAKNEDLLRQYFSIADEDKNGEICFEGLNFSIGKKRDMVVYMIILKQLGEYIR